MQLQGNTLLDIGGISTASPQFLVQLLDDARVTGTGSAPLIDAGGALPTQIAGPMAKIAGSTVSGFTNFLLMDGQSAAHVNVTLNSPFLLSTTSASVSTTPTIGTTWDFMHITGGTSLTSNTASPLVGSASSVFTVGAPGGHSHFLLVDGVGGPSARVTSASFRGPSSPPPATPSRSRLTSSRPTARGGSIAPSTRARSFSSPGAPPPRRIWPSSTTGVL